MARHRCSRELGEQLGGEAMLQLPRDGDGALAFVADVFGWAEEPEGSLVGSHPGEQHHLAASLLVLQVALARRAGHARGRLGLPVDEVAADGVVAVSRGG